MVLTGAFSRWRSMSLGTVRGLLSPFCLLEIKQKTYDYVKKIKKLTNVFPRRQKETKTSFAQKQSTALATKDKTLQKWLFLAEVRPSPDSHLSLLFCLGICFPASAHSSPSDGCLNRNRLERKTGTCVCVCVNSPQRTMCVKKKYTSLTGSVRMNTCHCRGASVRTNNAEPSSA